MIRKNSGDGACIVCLEASPAPIQSGCACRGDSGLAHIDCLVRVAASQQAQRGTELWWLCQTCKQPFTGAMQAGLAEAWPNHRLPRMSGFIHPHAFTNLGGFVMCPKCGRTPADVQAAPLEEKLCLAPNPSGAEAPPPHCCQWWRRQSQRACGTSQRRQRARRCSRACRRRARPATHHL
jgi:hypothetical protein